MPSKRKTQQPGICGGNGCYLPKRPGHYYCARCNERSKASQNRIRNYRRLLGFCRFCSNPALPGHTNCEKHRALSSRNQTRLYDKRKKARGWKMVRVSL